MASRRPSSKQWPRELRRRVVLPARMRAGAQWSDACILNISSRGLMIHSGRAGPAGSKVELRRGPHVIVAQIVWSDGSRAGLRSDERVPIEDIVTASQTTALQLVASDGALVERRGRARPPPSDEWTRGRILEFLGVGAIALTLSIATWGMAREALTRPIAEIEAALGPDLDLTST